MGINKNAVIVLHEIYGINSFIKDICENLKTLRFDVFCPDMLEGKRFPYSKAEEAHSCFYSNIKPDYYKEVEVLISMLKSTYDKVFVLGFSAGAAIAWRCCEYPDCDGIICCYGSRIMDYLMLKPVMPVLLLFAEKDFFDVKLVAKELVKKQNVELYILPADHGFMDPYSASFDAQQNKIAEMHIRRFLGM